LIRAEAGAVHVNGRIGYCPQAPGLFELLTADDPLVMFGRGAGIGRAESLRLGHQILDEFGSPLHERVVTRDLSGGTRQKVNVALALLADRSILHAGRARPRRGAHGPPVTRRRQPGG
jgi:ABC-type multidrug transport system ATPase subunit